MYYVLYRYVGNDGEGVFWEKHVVTDPAVMNQVYLALTDPTGKTQISFDDTPADNTGGARECPFHTCDDLGCDKPSRSRFLDPNYGSFS